MRKLTLHMTITVDGFIAKPDGTLWEAFPWPAEMQEFNNDFFGQLDIAIYGRLNYQTIVPWWHDVAIGKPPADVPITEHEIEFANILEGIGKIVFSRTMDAEATDAMVLEGDAASSVAELKQRTGGPIVLHGGAGLVVPLAEANLIDEYMLFVSPAAIGTGRPLFSGLHRELRLRLLETRAFNSAFTLLRFQPTATRQGPNVRRP
jgi:dihydrofolate reductase